MAKANKISIGKGSIHSTNAPYVNVDAFKKHIVWNYNSNETLGIIGIPGVGKSQIVGQAVETIGKEQKRKFCQTPTATTWDNPEMENFRVIVLSGKDETEFGGYPSKTMYQDKEIMGYLSFDLIPTTDMITNPEAGHGVIFLDEFANASDAVKNAVQNILSSRQINGKDVHPNTRFIIASNSIEDNSGAGNIDKAKANRINWIVYSGVNGKQLFGTVMPKELKREVNPMIGLYMMEYASDEVNNFNADSPALAFPTQRSWERVNNMIIANTITDIDDITEIIASAVGVDQAEKFRLFIDLSKVIDIKELLQKPAMIKQYNDMSNPGTLYSIIVNLISYVSSDQKQLPNAFNVALELDDNLAIGSIILKGLHSTCNKKKVIDTMIELEKKDKRMEKFTSELLECFSS